VAWRRWNFIVAFFRVVFFFFAIIDVPLVHAVASAHFALFKLLPVRHR
jgi:hypothetical protein